MLTPDLDFEVQVLLGLGPENCVLINIHNNLSQNIYLFASSQSVSK